MKPLKENMITGIGEALSFIDTRISLLHNLCIATQDTAQNTGKREDPKDVLNRVFELLLILEDEIELLDGEVKVAYKVAANKQEPAVNMAGEA